MRSGSGPGSYGYTKARISGRRPAGSPELMAGPVHHAAKSASYLAGPPGVTGTYGSLCPAQKLNTSPQQLHPHHGPHVSTHRMLSLVRQRSIRADISGHSRWLRTRSRRYRASSGGRTCSAGRRHATPSPSSTSAAGQPSASPSTSLSLTSWA